MPVLIDVKAVSRAATRKDLEEIRKPEDLPAGTSLSADIETSLLIRAPIRWSWQMHWVREAAAGVLQGLCGIRADASAEARVDAAWDGVFRAEVSREEDRLRLRMFRGKSTCLQAGVTLAAGSPNTADELLQAITGKHPLGWLQSVLGQMGGQRWLEAAEAAGIPTRALEDLTSRWQRLGPQEQAALFRAAGQPDWLQLIREWSQRIANELKGQAALHQAVSEWPWHEDEASRTLLDWLNSAAGSVVDAPLAAEAFDRLLASAREVHALLDQERVVNALQKLHAKAFDIALPALEGLDGLAQALGARAGTALEKAFSAELALRASRTTEDTALIDAQFEFSAAGLEAYRRTLSGDLQPALRPGTAGVQVRHALLSHHVLKRFELELHLPFVETRNWECKTDAMAQAEITTDESGRTVVVSARAQNGEEARNRYQSVLTVAGGWLKRGAEDPRVSFSLAFDDRRRVKAGDDAQPWYRVLAAYGLAEQAQAWVEAAGVPVEAALTVRAPGELVADWIGLPSEREAAFFPQFRRASVAVQRALRDWLPSVWFADLDRYEDLGSAFPLLVYQATDAFPGRPRAQFAYDAMDPLSMERAWRSAARRLGRLLEEVHHRLEAAGKSSTAAFYEPEQAASILGRVQRQPRLVHALLMGDAAMVNQMAELAESGRDIQALLERDQAKAIRELARFGERFTKAFRKRLRRLYACEGFEALGSILLVEASAALSGRGVKPVEAVLRLRCGNREQVLASGPAR
jgi:hypothetical protein